MTVQTARDADDPRYRSGPLIRRLWRGYLAPHSGLMVIAALVLIVEGSTLGALSWALKPLFDSAFASGRTGMLYLFGAAILGLFVLRAGVSILSRYLLTRITQASTTALQVDLLRHMLRLEIGYFIAHAPGTLIERVQGDTQAVQGLWTTFVTGAARDIISLISLFAVALSIDPSWTLAAVVGVPLLILPVAVAQRYIRRKSASVRAQAGERATRLDEVFHGIQAVKLNRLEDYQSGRFAAIVTRIRRAEMKMALGRAVIPATVDIVTGIGFFAVLVLAGSEIAAGRRTVGDFMSFFAALALMFHPLRRLGDTFGTWQIAAASLERIFRTFDLPPETRRLAAPAQAPRQAPRIEIRDLHFAYPGRPVLDGLSFTAEPGTMTALVGPSGAGKSTVFGLLTGLLVPASGRILLDGTDAADLDLASLRAVFSVVSQDAALFDETIRDNVTLGRDTSPDRLASALEAARVSDFAAEMPEGIETRAGPRGVAFSGGQRQRVAIARALLADAPVLLLDEATSALDAASEALVSDALTRLTQGRTTLVIAHRLATIRHADRIVVMDRGRIVDQGRHDELLARGGLYGELCRLQFRD